MHGFNLRVMVMLLTIIVASAMLIHVLADNNFSIKEIDWNTQPQYIILHNLTRNNEAIGNATGKWYPPVPPINHVSGQPQYLIQHVLPTNPKYSTGVGEGSGRWYPPIPPINYVSKGPQYLLQWVLPRNMGNGFRVNVTISTNTTTIYVGEYVAVTINVSSSFSTLSGGKVYLYVVRDNVSSLSTTRYTLTLINSIAHTVLRLNTSGYYTLYAIFPRQGIYLESKSNNVSIRVDKYPLTLKITVDKNKVKYGEPFIVTIYASNPIRNINPTNIYVKIYVLRKGAIQKVWKTKITNGEARLKINISRVGTYILYAESIENQIYKRTTSDKLEIQVYPNNPLGGTPVILLDNYMTILTIITVILFAGMITWGLLRRKKRYTSL